jgi:acetyltransferase-like isoleucine patch superfamily enzyme
MIKRYGVIGTLRMVISLIYTKLFFSQARIIRLPFDIRNRKWIQIGKNFTTGFNCRIEAFPIGTNNEKCLRIGNNVQINDHVHIASAQKVWLGDNVLIASKVFITDISHGNYDDTTKQESPLIPPNDRKLSTKPVVIEDNVWIGETVCILPGVTIGKGCIIGALSVVTKSIAPYSIAVGNPARVIKVFDFNLNEWKKV